MRINGRNDSLTLEWFASCVVAFLTLVVILILAGLSYLAYRASGYAVDHEAEKQDRQVEEYHETPEYSKLLDRAIRRNIER